MRIITLTLCLLVLFTGTAQQEGSQVLNFREYLGLVKTFHPVAKQARLTLDIGQAELLRARGAFDPKIEVDYERKKFNGTEYWDRLNTTFKVPTWYGIELKGNFQQNSGDFLNPDEFLPDDGLFSAGVTLSLGDGLWINERMATLKQAKFFREQTLAERDLQVNEILFRAAIAYFDWLKAYNEQEIFRNFLDNAADRFDGIRRSALAGDIAAIDTVEARIAVESRVLGLEQAALNFTKKSLELSNFLWLDNNIPVELQPGVIPDSAPGGEIDITLDLLGRPMDSVLLEEHPKLLALGYKIDGLEVEKRLKVNQLLPRIDLEYNFLTETPELLNSYDTQQYKGGINFELPLFLRKERGALKLAKYKLQYAEFEYDNTALELRNKISAVYRELESFEDQSGMIGKIVADYRTLLAGEERKFSFGESSLFLINTRESRLIDAELKQNEVENKFFTAKAYLFRTLAINPENL
ncbi:MAG: TolC family protein [Flavobacteriaceae bacterium]